MFSISGFDGFELDNSDAVAIVSEIEHASISDVIHIAIGKWE